MIVPAICLVVLVLSGCGSEQPGGVRVPRHEFSDDGFPLRGMPHEALIELHWLPDSTLCPYYIDYDGTPVPIVFSKRIEVQYVNRSQVWYEYPPHRYRNLTDGVVETIPGGFHLTANRTTSSLEEDRDRMYESRGLDDAGCPRSAYLFILG